MNRHKRINHADRYAIDAGKGVFQTFPSKNAALRCALEFARCHQRKTYVFDLLPHKGMHNVWNYNFADDRMVAGHPIPD